MTITAVLPRREVDHRVALPTVVVVAVTAWFAWRGWAALRGYGELRSIHAGQAELAGPVVLGFVLAVFIIEQVMPAERHRVLARGHVLDVGYLLAHALVVVPMIILIGTGFSASLARVAPWLVLPRNSTVPHWCYVALAVVAIDAVDWLAHLANHKIGSLWRLHAVHHSQEELSILSTFRTHPLVHLSFVISAIPVLALASNGATPTAVLTAYACLGALPHANVRWG
jgi:sterol desaturase/sphingolipid hydroxylase (fatty acid hydroxylase superfamily)